MTMTKILNVTLLNAMGLDPFELRFDMGVPVNVFAMGELEITPDPRMGSVQPIRMNSVIFIPRTNGTVEVKGRTPTHTRQMALEFLRAHPDVSMTYGL